MVSVFMPCRGFLLFTSAPAASPFLTTTVAWGGGSRKRNLPFQRRLPEGEDEKRQQLEGHVEHGRQIQLDFRLAASFFLLRPTSRSLPSGRGLFFQGLQGELAKAASWHALITRLSFPNGVARSARITTVVGSSPPASRSAGRHVIGQQRGLRLDANEGVDVANGLRGSQIAGAVDVQHQQARAALGVDRPGRSDHRQTQIEVDLGRLERHHQHEEGDQLEHHVQHGREVRFGLDVLRHSSRHAFASR